MHVVMTGATAGFGRDAAARLAAAGHSLTVGARSPDAVPRDWVAAAMPLDLDDRGSIERFCAAAAQRPPIDALLLNAGIQLGRPATTAAGFERTFAVNHLAHFLILHRLLPHLAPAARVVLTGSGTHDPTEGTPVTPPDHADAERLAYPDRDPTVPAKMRARLFRAYSSSKLANIMTARALAKRRPDLAAMSYDPGYVPWTGLGRDHGAILAFLSSLIVPRLMKKDRSSDIATSGQWLAALATDDAYARASGDYWSVRYPDLVRIAPSALARDDDACAKLWDDSAALLQI